MSAEAGFLFLEHEDNRGQKGNTQMDMFPLLSFSAEVGHVSHLQVGEDLLTDGAGDLGSSDGLDSRMGVRQ